MPPDSRTYIRLLIVIFAVTALFLIIRSTGEERFGITSIETEPYLQEEGSGAFYTNTTHDDIVVTSPKPGSVITSPLIIEGEAVGPWFFEANAGLVLTDWDGRIIAEHYVEAQGEWMTEDKVSFRGVLEFETPEYGEGGTLILRAANPSGLPEYDRTVEIPVTFVRE